MMRVVGCRCLSIYIPLRRSSESVNVSNWQSAEITYYVFQFGWPTEDKVCDTLEERLCLLLLLFKLVRFPECFDMFFECLE